MDNPRLFTGSIRNHPAGIAPDSLIRLSPSPCGQKNPSGVLRENSARIKLSISIFISRASSAATDAGYGIRPPSPTILLLLNLFSQPLATIPCLRAPTSGLFQFPSIPHPALPSSSPPLHTHLRNLSVVDLNLRTPNTHRTLRRYSAPALCVFSSYSIGCASIKRRTSARISSFIASNV